MLRDSLDGVTGLPLEPPREMPLEERWQDRVDERAAARLRQREHDPVCPHCDDIQQDPLRVVAGPQVDGSTVLSCHQCEGWFVVYDEMPEPRYVRTCPAKGCDGGVIYAGRASFSTGDATFAGGEEFETCGMCGGLGQVGS